VTKRVARSAPRSETRTYENVPIQILGLELAAELRATVLVRKGEMVLDIELEGDRYLITGKLVGSFYAGKDEVRDGVQVDLVARWCLLGDVWVGWWLEDGVEYLFSFRLPKR
jgi:hypothetical protein